MFLVLLSHLTSVSLPAFELEVLLDPNELDAGGTTALGSTAFTRDGSLMAYSIAKDGSDWNSIHVRDVSTCMDRKGDSVSWVKFSGIQWLGTYGFFYSSYRKPSDRPPMGKAAGTETAAAVGQMLCFHMLGTSEQDDIIVVHEPDHPKWRFSAELSDDDKYLLIYVRETCDPVCRLYMCALPDIQPACLPDRDRNLYWY